MRVLDATADVVPETTARARSLRVANVELIGLLACSVVVALGLWATTWGRFQELAAESPADHAVDLRHLRGAEDLLAVLPMFEDRTERLAAARALYRRAVGDTPALTHVGGLAETTIPAAEVRGSRRYARLGARLARTPGADRVAVLTSADVAAIKPNVVVRTRAEATARLRDACLWFFAGFWLVHVMRRARAADDDPLLVPGVMLLTGLGLMSMIALRDPLRDTLAATTFAQGVAAGLVALVVVAEVDFEASWLRRAVVAPLAGALVLASLLLVFGSGPGSSGVKVNLLGVQPVEAIRLLVVFALAAYFARRGELLREISDRPAAAAPWLRVPRWRDVRPVVVSMTLVLAFFFLQKDLGPALVVSFVVMALYAIARGRAGVVALGLGMLALGFASAYWIGYPATVRQRVQIWLDPWNNGVPGGNQIAHGLWALSSGALTGAGPGMGSAASVPAAHTDFILAAIGEQLGFVGVLIVFALYALLAWRCLRIAARAPGDYSAFLVAGLSLGLVLQAIVIASGLLGLFPLSGVVTPFLSYGRSSMVANCLAIGVVLSVARRSGPVRRHLERPLQILGVTLGLVLAVVVGRAGWVQVVHADDIATASSLSEQADGGYRFEYNPRLVSMSRLLERGTISDRNGLPLATSRASEIASLDQAYRQAGITPEQACLDQTSRCYPLPGIAFHVVGDWTGQTNWGARNASYIERESDATLKGFDDHQRLVEVRNPRTGEMQTTIRRDYRDLLPLVRHRHQPGHPAAAALLTRGRDVRASIDARLQVRVAAALQSRIVAGGYARGAAVVIDASTGDVLASVSYPWPSTQRAPAAGDDEPVLLDRPRYGLYPPGSTFKLLVAGAALRSQPALEDARFDCVRLPDGRVGNAIRGWSRPVRDDPMDTRPHGHIGLHDALVVSCNAYFAQLAQRLGPGPILDAAGFFQIDTARPSTASALRATLPQAGYGQGQVLVSPLKMARIAGAVADGGMVRPLSWLARDLDGGAATAPRFLSRADAELLGHYMRDAVTTGTGRTLAANPTPIAGKTGTAEVDHGRAHSWFAGYAPYGGPHPIAFAVIVENAGYGARAAAPVAGDIVTAARELGLFKDATGGGR